MQCHSLNIEKVQTLEGYTLRFWKNIFRLKYIDLVHFGETRLCCQHGHG